MNKLKLSLGFRLSTSFLYFHVILEPQTKLRSSSSHASLTLSVISVLVQWHHPLSTSKHPIFLLALTSSDIQSLKNSLIPHKFLSLCAAIYSEPLSSFLTYCNNLQIPFSVAPFHQPPSNLLSLVQWEILLQCYLLRSLFFSNVYGVQWSFSISAKLINIKGRVWTSSCSLLHEPWICTPGKRRPVSNSVTLLSWTSPVWTFAFTSSPFPDKINPLSKSLLSKHFLWKSESSNLLINSVAPYSSQLEYQAMRKLLVCLCSWLQYKFWESRDHSCFRVLWSYKGDSGQFYLGTGQGNLIG